MNGSSKKIFLIPVMKIDSVSISGVVQIGNSLAVLPHIDTLGVGGPRGAASFNTQTFPRSRTRFHLHNEEDVETVGDLSILTPAPDQEQAKEIYQRYHACMESFRRFEADGNKMNTISESPIMIQNIVCKTILASGVLHIGDTKCVAPLVHDVSRGIVAGAVVGAGGPVGAIGV